MEVLHRLFGTGRSFRREFKRQIRLLIIITLGFTIAFTWRQTVFDLSLAFVKSMTNIRNDSELSILASLFITVLSVVLIYLVAHLLKDSDY
ncbi:MAG: DUF5654 family protein [Nanoarchaeota archaeon]